MTAPRIADLIPRLQLRGAEVFAQHLEVALRDRYDPALFPLVAEDGPLAATPPPPLEVHRARSSGRLRTAGDLRARVKRFAPSLIVAHGGDPLRTAVAARLHRVAPIVYVRIASVPPELRTSARMRSLRKAYAAATAIVAVSESLRGELVDVFDVDPAQITVIRNGRLRQPPLSDEERAAVRGELGIPAGRPMVTWVGRFVAEKDPVAAAAVASATGSAASVVMVGEGPLMAETAAVGAPVTLTGARSDVARIIAASDLLMSTSVTEGAPGVFVEALLAGVPIVSPDVGGVRDLLQHEVNGMLIPPGAGLTTRLSETITTLVSDRARLARLTEGAEASGRRFEIGPVADEYDALYRRILGTPASAKTSEQEGR